MPKLFKYSEFVSFGSFRNTIDQVKDLVKSEYKDHICAIHIRQGSGFDGEYYSVDLVTPLTPWNGDNQSLDDLHCWYPIRSFKVVGDYYSSKDKELVTNRAKEISSELGVCFVDWRCGTYVFKHDLEIVLDFMKTK